MIKVRDIAYVRYQVPDPNLQAAFLGDFGLVMGGFNRSSQH
ncbi:hypothetical protein [Paraburkholderia sp.]|nr:hypothetical protein [Paraburkholderia sp.]HZZ02650.1 hypothetical protein [Paraburkholderia sp.]